MRSSIALRQGHVNVFIEDSGNRNLFFSVDRLTAWVSKPGFRQVQLEPLMIIINTFFA